uniref:Antitoxin family protein n=1 Tax=viral metagenome TaxID=1070528 RepID=A0A6M3XX34_9ZZZZ
MIFKARTKEIAGKRLIYLPKQVYAFFEEGKVYEIRALGEEEIPLRNSELQSCEKERPDIWGET